MPNLVVKVYKEESALRFKSGQNYILLKKVIIFKLIK